MAAHCWAPHWLAAHGLVALLALVLTGLTPAPAQAFAPDRCGIERQPAFAPGAVPRQVEADLPAPLDAAVPIEMDTDAAVPRRIVIRDVVGFAPVALMWRSVLPATPSRVFNPRAPPSLR